MILSLTFSHFLYLSKNQSIKNFKKIKFYMEANLPNLLFSTFSYILIENNKWMNSIYILLYYFIVFLFHIIVDYFGARYNKV